MRLLPILCLINFSLCEIVNLDIVSSSSSEESVEDGELATLELNTAANNDPLNKCLSIKNQIQVSNCVFNLCDKKCSQLSDSSSEEKDEFNKCRWGCKLQVDSLKMAKQNYPQTPTTNLLGQSIDKCWKDCDGMNLIRKQVSTCVTGCNEMRKLQKSQMLMKKTVESTDEETSGIPSAMSYVFWRGGDDDDVMGMSLLDDSDNILQVMFSIINSVFSDIEPVEFNNNRRGYSDDRLQLIIPRYISKPVAKQSSRIHQSLPSDTSLDHVKQPERWFSSLTGSDAEESAEEWLGKVKNNVEEFAQQLKSKLNSARTKEFLYYTLLTISLVMLMVSTYDICIKSKDQPENLEQEYEEMMKTKLPTYEECMMAEPCKYNLQVEVHAPTEYLTEKKSLN